MVLRFQTVTLLVAVGTLALTVLLVLSTSPRASFPIQDTGVIQGVSEAAQTISFRAMSDAAAGARPRSSCKDPAVESLSSFIGIDGTNTTLNSGRIQINLKPLDERKISATDVIRRLQPKLDQSRRHHAVHAAGAGSDRGRPRQPHAVSIHARRSQRRRAEHLRAARWSTKLKQLPELRDVASDQQVQGLRATLILRPRHRLAPGHHAHHDRPDALRRLRPAPGLHHVHAAEPVSRRPRSEARLPAAIRSDLRDLYIRTGAGVAAPASRAWCRAELVHRRFRPDRQCRGAAPLPASSPAARASLTSSAFTAPMLPPRRLSQRRPGAARALSRTSRLTAVPITVNHQGQFPVVTLSFNLAPDASLGDAVNAVNKVKDEIGMPASIQAAVSRHRRRRSRLRSPTSRC